MLDDRLLQGDYYFQKIDWEALVREVPPPREFMETVYRAEPEAVRAMQADRFREVVRHGWNNSFYRRVWTSAGLRPGDVVDLDEAAKLPVVTVEDFRESFERRPPFGEHQGIDPEDVAAIPFKIQTSGGTTGKPRPIFAPPIEWEMEGISAARMLYAQGAVPGSRIQIPVTPSLAAMGWTMFRAVHQWLRSIPITTGSGAVTPTRKQLEIAKEWGTTGWVGFGDYFLRMAAEAREMGLDLKALPTQSISAFLGHYDHEAIRRDIEAEWGCPVYDNFGLHEAGIIAFECPERNGLHIEEDIVLFEVVDPDTGAPVSDGQMGSLVVTSLVRRFPPIIRYDTRDLVRVLPEGRCRCGSHLRRMDHYMGRIDEMVKLRGQSVFPMACRAAVLADPRTTGEWLCVVTRRSDGLSSRDEMTVCVECREAVGVEGMGPALEERLRADLGVRVQVRVVPAGVLQPYTGVGGEGKPKRLLDLRPGVRNAIPETPWFMKD